MPTPPLKRRNPAVLIRRVQSDRRYLNPWGLSPQCHVPCKYKYDYARRTAIIPPPGPQPHMIGTSQGVLSRPIIGGPRYPLTHSRSEAHLQPLVLVAPPLIVGAFSPPQVDIPQPPRPQMTEDEILANERLASFLTESPPPHRPKSLISYPESHLYESLISRVSDSSTEDVSVADLEEDVYQKIHRRSPGGSSSGSLGWSDISGEELPSRLKFPKITTKKPRESNFKSNLRNCTSEIRLASTEEQKSCPTCHTLIVKNPDETRICPVGKWNRNLRSCENLKDDVNEAKPACKICHTTEVKTEKIIPVDETNHDNGKGKQKHRSFRQSFVNNVCRSNSSNYLRSIFRIKKKQVNYQSEEIPSKNTVQPNLSSKDSKTDNECVLENSAQECDKNNFCSNHEQENHCCERGKKNSETQKNTIRKSKSMDLSKSFGCFNKNESVYAISSDFQNSRPPLQSNIYHQRTPVIPSTIELPESITTKRIVIEKNKGNDKGIQVSSDDIALSQGHKGMSTLDPLRPTNSKKAVVSTSCKNCEHKAMIPEKNILDYSLSMNKRHSPLNARKPARTPSTLNAKYKNCFGDKRSSEVTPFVSNFDSETSSSDNETMIPQNRYSTYLKQAKRKPKEAQSGSSSSFEVYSVSATSPSSFVYIYESPPKLSDKSSGLSSSDYRSNDYPNRLEKKVNIERRGGSSGLGSSESETSCEENNCSDVTHIRDVTHNRDVIPPSDEKSSVAFLEPSFDSGSSPSPQIASVTTMRGRLHFDYSWNWHRLND